MNNKYLKYFLLTFGAYSLFNIGLSSYLFFSHFPSNYTWVELLINYQGGFIRRGLIGELLFHLAPYSSIQILTGFLFFVLYAIFVILSIKLFKSSCDDLTLLLIVTSPGLLLFFSQDRDMLCRKDIFYETGLIIQFVLLSSKNIKFIVTASTVIFIYSLCLLIHESTIFYSILPFVLLLELARRNSVFFPCFLFLSLVALISIWYIFSFSGTTFQKDLIMASWSPWFSLPAERALRFIGKPLSFQLAQVREYISLKVFFYFLLALCLTGFPLLRMIKIQNVFSRIMHFFTFPGNRFLLLCGFISPWVLPFIAIDYGRHIHTAIFYQMAFFASVILLTGGTPHEKNNLGDNTNVGKTCWIGLILYAFGWKLWHFAEGGNIVTFSFPIRALLVGWIDSLSV